MAHMFDPPNVLPLEKVEPYLSNWLVCHSFCKTASRDEIASLLYHEFLGKAREQMLNRLIALYVGTERKRLHKGMQVTPPNKKAQNNEFDFGIQ